MLNGLQSVGALQLAGAIAVLLGLFYAQVGWAVRSHRHYGWLAAGCLTQGIWWAAIPPAGNTTHWQLSDLPWILLGVGSGSLVWVGMIKHLLLPPRTESLAIRGLVALNLLLASFLALLLAHRPMVRGSANALYFLQFLPMAALAFRAAMLEPRTGHAVAGAFMLMLPALGAWVWWTAEPGPVMRYAAVLPYLAMMLAVLPSAFIREHRRLKTEVGIRMDAEARVRRINQTLETRIEARTRDLQEALAAAERATAAKSRFLAVMSHEIRTPLGGLMGSIALLRDEAGTAEAAELLAMAEQSGRQLRRVLDNVLDVTKLEVGVVSLERQSTDLGDVCRGAVDGFTALAARRGLELSLDLPAPLPRILCDELRLRQILDNLLSNAIKFTDRGGVALRVAIGPSVQGQVHLRIDVEDTGRGVSAQDRPHIFEPFEQGRTGLGRASGTGLGLHLSRSLATLLGGSLVHLDRPGGGSIFRFEALCTPSPEDSVQTLPAALDATPEATLLQERRILVADDNAIAQAMLGRVLRKAGAEVVSARSGRQAIEALTSTAFDAVLMDVSMPDMNGLEATRAIRALSASQADAPIPIIGISAHALEGDREACLAAGMTDYLPKPVDHTALLRVLAANTAARARAAAPGHAPRARHLDRAVHARAA